LALAASQSALDGSDTQPCPLQLFWPLQLFFADLHSDVPLQEFTPVHFTVAVSAATDTPVKPDVNNIAAAAASAALDTLLICMFAPHFLLKAAKLLPAYKTRPTARLLRSYMSLCLAIVGADPEWSIRQASVFPEALD
jgi:hypothetical protein